MDEFLLVSYVLNSFLMLQKPLLPTIDKMWSLEVSIANRQMIVKVEVSVNKMLAGIREHIEKYIAAREEDVTNKE